MTVVPVETREKKSVFRETVNDFFDSSTIHGVKYIGTRPWHEKLWWLIVFIISLCICIYQISAIYTKWKLTPVIITFDETFTSVGEIPFPAITICGRFIFNDNQTQLNYDAFQYPETEITEMDEDILDLFEFASDVCLDNLYSPMKKKILKDFENRTSSSMLKTVEKMFSVDSSDFMSKCRGIESPGGWRCHRAFVKVVTRYGICMTFNMLQKREIVRENVTIFLEEGKSETHGWNPETVSREFVAKFKSFYSGQCLSDTRVFVHHPHDFPWNAKTSMTLFNVVQPIIVTPKIMKTSLDMRDSISPDKRNCFFDGERNLTFFKIYSKSNCELECLTNITLDQCKCVQFWMPRHPDTPICGISQHKCSNFLALRYLNINIATTAREILEKYDIPYKCNCLERCNSVTYSAIKLQSHGSFNDDDEEQDKKIPLIYTGNGSVIFESSRASNQTLFPYSVVPPIFSAFVDENFMNVYNTSFKIQFEESQFLSYKRIVPYEVPDFIANCGGLLGLFMGISILSLVEIIYFCTFRLIEAIVIAIKGRSQ
ncbi:pickpocket protein 28-like [Culicoides brevitarsis]|uniref:pickpocket protein 28-like n=1 Tax=Culicoides brevitarsis TaxID=469753 RepID=UPI00307C5CCB